jgi:hypothetical protein
MGEDIFEGDAERASQQEPWQAWRESRAKARAALPKDKQQAKAVKRQQRAENRQQRTEKVEALGQRAEQWFDDKEQQMEVKAREREAREREPRKPRKGLITRGKEVHARDEARRAFAEGHTLFAYQLAGRLFDWFGSVTGYAEQLEAIEAEGWRLEQISYAGGTKGDAVQIALFRRVETP